MLSKLILALSTTHFYHFYCCLPLLLLSRSEVRGLPQQAGVEISYRTTQGQNKCGQLQVEMQETPHISEYRLINGHDWSGLPQDLLRRIDGIFKESSGEYKIPDVATIKISDDLYEAYQGTGTMLCRVLYLNGYMMNLELWPRKDPLELSTGIGNLDKLLKTLDPRNQIPCWELLHWLLSLGDNKESDCVNYNNDTVHFIMSRLQHHDSEHLDAMCLTTPCRLEKTSAVA